MADMEIQRDPRKAYDFLHRTIPRCIEFARDLKFDKTHQWHMALVTLYGSVLEMSHAILVLVNGDAGIGVPIILRSLLEAFLDLNNLVETKSYGYHLDAGHWKEWIKILQEAKLGQNPYLEEISKSPDLDQMLAEFTSKLNELTKKGIKPLKQFEKFERCSLTAEYLSIYNYLCCDSHNNLRSLFDRHTEITEDRMDFQVQFFKEFDFEENLQHIESCLGILVQSTVIIHKALESPRMTEVEGLQSELAILRNPFLA